MEDKIRAEILKVLKKAGEPLETKEIESQLKEATRSKVLYRLNDLRGTGQIKGKQVGSGKGTWVWWVSALAEKVK